MMVLTTFKGWFQNLLKSRGNFSAQQEKEGKITKDPVNGVSSSASASSLHSSLPPRVTLLKSQQLENALNSELRWNRKYDVFVCHSSSDADIEEAKRMVFFLESPPRCLRCFLWPRDSCPGGAISTEFSQAVEDSHIQALLITPSFVQDDWCNYIMHRALAEGPMSNRVIPLLQNMPHSQYPQELKFYFYIDLSKDPNQGYSICYKTVLRYLESLVKNEEKSYLKGERSRGGLNVEGSSQEEKLMSTLGTPGTSSPSEVMQKRAENFSDISSDHN